VSLTVPGPLLVRTGTDALMAHVSGSPPPRLEASPMDDQSSSLCPHLLPDGHAEQMLTSES